MTTKATNIVSEREVDKKIEVAKNKELYPLKTLEKPAYFSSHFVSLKEYILRSDKSRIIDDFKRKFPSKPAINIYSDSEKVLISEIRIHSFRTVDSASILDSMTF